MKICFEQFLGNLHSWSQTSHHLARAFIKNGHEVHLKSTNGYQWFPEDLKNNIRENLDHNYDLQLSYTAIINFQKYLSHGKKNRFGIWNYETTVLPPSFAKCYKHTDHMLPSSNFSKEIFIQNGIPEKHLTVIPHGIDASLFSNKEKKYPLKTKKKYKILANIAQPHLRKNISGLLTAYGKAFTKNDDVCLVAKVVVKKPTENFEVSFLELFEKFKKNFPQHAEVEIISEYVEDMVSLYNVCDIVYSMTHAECFWLPGLEALAAEKIIIVSNYGGQLDFLNIENSFLINGKIVQAPLRGQYWHASPLAAWFEPDVEDAAFKLKQSVDNFDLYKEKFSSRMKSVVEKHSWDCIVEKILNLL